MHFELDNRQKQLLTELETVSKSKERILQQQEKGLLATVDGIRKESQQLQLALGVTSRAKAVVLMEQLGQHLSSIDELEFRPRELAAMGFQQVPVVVPEICLVDATESGTTVTSTRGSFPVVLSTHIRLSRFEITGGTKEAKLQITNLAKGKYAIQPDIERKDEETVAVKLLGQHVCGSPVRCFFTRNWSSSSTYTRITNNTMEAIQDHAWGMIQQEFSITSRPLQISVKHICMWKECSLVLCKTFDAAHTAARNESDSLAFHHSLVPIIHPPPLSIANVFSGTTTNTATTTCDY